MFVLSTDKVYFHPSFDLKLDSKLKLGYNNISSNDFLVYKYTIILILSVK